MFFNKPITISYCNKTMAFKNNNQFDSELCGEVGEGI